MDICSGMVLSVGLQQNTSSGVWNTSFSCNLGVPAAVSHSFCSRFLCLCRFFPFPRQFPRLWHAVMAAELSCVLHWVLWNWLCPAASPHKGHPWSCSPTPGSTLTPESSALSHLFCSNNYLIVIHSHSSFLLLGPVILIIVLWTISS